MCDNLLHWFVSQCMVWLVVGFFIRLSSLASPVEANEDDLQVSEPKKPEPTVYAPPILNPYYSEFFLLSFEAGMWTDVLQKVSRYFTPRLLKSRLARQKTMKCLPRTSIVSAKTEMSLSSRES